MTARERILALVQGKEVDRKPTLAWPKKDDTADVAICPAGQFATNVETGLGFVPNVYQRLYQLGEDPIAIAKDASDPTAGAVEETDALNRMEARNAISNGALGVFYEIHGATAAQCTPMEYGGLFLERDREFLESISDAQCNVIYINGKEPYLDFVCDLPAHVFAWDAKGSGISVAAVRKMRSGLLAAADPDADIILNADGSITDALEGLLAHA